MATVKRPGLEARIREIAEVGPVDQGSAEAELADLAALLCGLVADRDELEVRVERLERRLGAQLDRESRVPKGRRGT